MFDLKKAMQTAASAMGAQSLRLRLLSENIANTETPGFRRKLTTFEAQMDKATGATIVHPGRVRLAEAPMREEYDPGHPLADDRGMVSYSNVDPVLELADAREASRSYEANLALYDQARGMRRSLLDLLNR
ncbi:MAG: flagellar basal body rod C-terminal domain-containing protein [Pseudomonadota bacterium]